MTTKEIRLQVSTDNEGTESPCWILIDPSSIKGMFEGVAEHGEIPDDERMLTAIAYAIEGPYFSREEATNYLKSRKYAYSDSAAVWCHSGYRSRQYRDALRSETEAKR